MSDIEAFFSDPANFRRSCENVLKIGEISEIVNGNYPEINPESVETEDFEEEADIFAAQYENAVKEFFLQTIRRNDWSNLELFYSKYFQLVSENNDTLLTEILTEKNEVLVQNFHHFEDLEKLAEAYPFAVNQDFFLLQSHLGAFEFTESVMDINNAVASRQHSANEKNKLVMGKILIALSYFSPFDDENARVLKDNRFVGEEWTAGRSSFLAEITKKIAAATRDESLLAVNIGIALFCLAAVGLLVSWLLSAETELIITFIFVFIIVAGLSVKQLDEYFHFLQKEFFPVYFLKITAGFTLLFVLAGVIFLVAAGVFGAVIDLENNKSSLGFLVFPVVYILLRLFNRKRTF